MHKKNFTPSVLIMYSINTWPEWKGSIKVLFLGAARKNKVFKQWKKMHSDYFPGDDDLEDPEEELGAKLDVE